MITRSHANTLNELEKTKNELEETKNELKIFKMSNYKLRIELKQLYIEQSKLKSVPSSNRLSDEYFHTRLKECRLKLKHKKKELDELKEKIECKFHEHINDIISDKISQSEMKRISLYAPGSRDPGIESNENQLNRLYSDWCNYLDVDINCTVNNEKCSVWPLNCASSTKDKDFSVLMKAAYKKKFKLCEFLIEKGAVVNSDEYMESCGIDKKSRDKLLELDRTCKLATDFYDKLPEDKKNEKGSRKYYRQKFKDLLNE